MDKQKLIEQIKAKKTFLIIGLDSDANKIPVGLTQFDFNKGIIDATHHLCVGYKINTAFYESEGRWGWAEMEKTIDYLNEFYPNHFTIADAKRGDIGNTSDKYAEAFGDFDSITLNPYMGEDSLKPFFGSGKWGIILALTSNTGSYDFQTMKVGDKELYKWVIEKSKDWDERIMYVVGGTRSSHLAEVRQIVPDHFLLIPGLGAQGADLHEIVKVSITKDCGLLVNASRSIIFASSDPDKYELYAKIEAESIQKEMEKILKKYILS